VEIVDPTAGIAYILDTVGKVAHRMRWPPRLSARSAARPSRPFRPFPRVAEQTVARHEIIEASAEGELATMTVPVGVMATTGPW